MKSLSAIVKLPGRGMRAWVVVNLLLAGLVTTSPSHAEFDKRWYLGVGGGISFIEPDPVDSGYIVDEDSSSGGKLFLGWDFSERWAVEGYFADLGEATLTQGPDEVLTPPEGGVDYQAKGLSAVYHLYNSRGRDARLDRLGLSLFGKLGGGQLDTSSDDLTIKQLEDYHLMLGVGAEYAFESGLALRAEFDAFDTDAQLASVSLMWRFGGGDSSSSAAAAVATAAGGVAASSSGSGQTATPADDQSGSEGGGTSPSQPGETVVLIDETQPTDSDYDGVADVLDLCPGTVSDVAVDGRGCPMFDKRLEGVNFLSGSATLTAGAKSALDQLAFDLANAPDVRIAIMAHTDNQGSAAGNLELSKKRAIAVARYLVSRGVAGQRLRPEAYGESQPIVSNATADGRRQNRRVEFRTLN